MIQPSRLIVVPTGVKTSGFRGCRARAPAGFALLRLVCHSLPALAATTAAALAQPPSLERTAAEWDAAVAAIVRRAEAGGMAELAAFVTAWDVPDEEGRQVVLAIPPRPETPDFIDTPDERVLWESFLDARRSRAATVFAAAVEAARAHDAPPERTAAPADKAPALAQRPAEAIRLLHRALRDDPEHVRAREAGGWVRHEDRWVWPEAARRLRNGDEFSAEFGWLPRGRQERYRAGERYEQGRWIKAGAQPPQRPGARREPLKFSSDHWQISSAAGPEAAAALAARLEETRTVWLQVFGAFQEEPAAWELRFAGRGGRAAAAGHKPFATSLAADRGDYVRALEPLEPSIARTLGIYWMPTRTAWFFPGEGQEPATIHHEASHQLFAETRRTSPLAGERCGFWAVEAAACYMEGIERTPFGWTVGGRDRGRGPVARERLVEDGFHVPLAELAALGRKPLQADQRLPQIYSEIAGLADFFMNGERGRYREAFIEYLARIYTGTADPDTLARLCRRDFSDLDDDYRRHMSR